MCDKIVTLSRHLDPRGAAGGGAGPPVPPGGGLAAGDRARGKTTSPPPLQLVWARPTLAAGRHRHAAEPGARRGVVTCHVSRVMCHVSRVMCHVSRVTCQMSHVTCHMSHVTSDVSHVTCVCVPGRRRRCTALTRGTRPSPHSPGPGDGVSVYHSSVGRIPRVVTRL